MKKINLGKLVIAIALPLGIGFLGSAVTFKEILGWYVGLNKPSLVPPNGVFGPVWTTLFVLIGISLYLYWTTKSKLDKKLGYLVYGMQLILNFLWSVLFFGFHSPALALIEIVFLWTTILVNIILFNKVSKSAALLLIPYLLWVSFATYLTLGVWRLN